MPLPAFAASSSDRALAGVCGGIASALGVDVTLVRLVFALLALAGGAGIVLYLALWLYADGRPVWLAGLGVVLSGSLLLHAVGLSDRAVAGIALGQRGAAVAWRRGAGLRPDAPLSYAGYALVAIGAVILLAAGGGAPAPLLAPGAVVGGLFLIAGPWLWRLALERDAERAARIRSEERADVAARVHDSVLQTLALIQRHADEPRRVASLARRQERELRGWLYADRPLGDDGTSVVAALSSVAADVEDVFGVRIELASSGDALTDGALVLAAREAMTNAAKFARRRGDRRLRGGHRDARSRSSSATAAPGSTPPPSRRTAAASPSRSRDGSSARAARRRSSRPRARAPRSSCASPRGAS